MDRQGQTCITHWYPRLEEAGIPQPRTGWVKLADWCTDEMVGWACDGGREPETLEWFLQDLRNQAIMVSPEGPWFLRTGVFSGKHDWNRCCHVKNLDKLKFHVRRLFELSQLVSLMGLPCDVWAVREWLPGPCIFKSEQFNGMPVRKEFRGFARAGGVLCLHPYWPMEALEADLRDAQNRYDRLAEMNKLRAPDDMLVANLMSQASMALEGEWSIDVLLSGDRWYVTDCAPGEVSWHWPECGRAGRGL